MPFTLATWNILATAYIRRDWYPRTPRRFLDPAWRIPALVRHARELGVDILCLQEVEGAVFEALQKGLDGLGYSGSLAMKGGNRPDGCATFFRRDGFTLVDNRRIAYSDGDGGADSGNIVQALLLEHEGKRIEIANTHLKWDSPETPGGLRLGSRQVRQAIEALQPDPGSPGGQILCGDLNADAGSDVIDALLAAGFDYAHRQSPGARTCNSNKQPKLIDHLFYRGSLLARAIPPADVEAETPLPSEQQPSDHVPLSAEFEWQGQA